MKMQTRTSQPLAKGQIWKTRSADIEIVALGTTLLHYRVIRQTEPKQVSAQISGIEAMSNYLQANAARLVNSACVN